MSNALDTSAGTHERPAPAVSAAARPYWDASAKHRFIIQRCSKCAHFQFPPRAVCELCWSDDNLEWRTAVGTGTVHSFTVVHRPPVPAFSDRVPYVLALVQLDEGPRLMSNIVKCDPDDVAIGQRVTVSFDDIRPGVSLPVFMPASVE
jgi:uncharacterized protein